MANYRKVRQDGVVLEEDPLADFKQSTQQLLNVGGAGNTQEHQAALRHQQLVNTGQLETTTAAHTLANAGSLATTQAQVAGHLEGIGTQKAADIEIANTHYGSQKPWRDAEAAFNLARANNINNETDLQRSVMPGLISSMNADNEAEVARANYRINSITGKGILLQDQLQDQQDKLTQKRNKYLSTATPTY